MNDPELETCAKLERRASEVGGADGELMKQAAKELRALVERLDALWQEHRFCGD